MGRQVVTPAQLGPALKRTIVRDVPKFVARKVHGPAHFELAKRVVLLTPVGNPDLWKEKPPAGYVGGRARGNWQSSTGAPATGETGRIDPGGGSSVTDAASVAVGIRGPVVSFIVNNVPYIQRLNTGWSRQVGAQFVQRSTRAVKRRFS